MRAKEFVSRCFVFEQISERFLVEYEFSGFLVHGKFLSGYGNNSSTKRLRSRILLRHHETRAVKIR
jgi:hypothetical protein